MSCLPVYVVIIDTRTGRRQQEHVWPAEAKFISPEYVADGTRIAIVEMVKGGTTCFNDMYFFPDETAKAVDES